MCRCVDEWRSSIKAWMSNYASVADNVNSTHLVIGATTVRDFNIYKSN